MGEVLQDDPHRRVERVGDTVRRPLHGWSSSVHDLLRHLEDIGFPCSPRFLGIDEQGREVLTYLAGDSGPEAWSSVVPDAGLTAMARLLREYHRAIADYRPATDWAGTSEAPAADEIICHGDFGPWNLVWHGTTPVGILDWDYAWPKPPLHDVAYALEYVAPFRSDEDCVRWLRYPAAPDRRARLETFATAYGLTSTDGLYDATRTQQQEVIARATALGVQGYQPQASYGPEVHADGPPASDGPTPTECSSKGDRSRRMKGARLRYGRAAARSRGPGLGGSDGQHHPPRHDIKLLTLIFREADPGRS